MYVPPKFRIEDATEIKDFLQQNSFGTCTSLHEGRIIASHLPWHLHETPENEWIMQAHMAKGNPQWKSIAENAEVMLMFQGAHTYITSRWYTEESAPTWNYQAVHLYGQARVVSEAELEEMLKVLIHQYEGDSPEALRYEHISDATRQKLLKGIVGVEIKITDVQAKYKLSQNRNPFDFQRIVRELEALPDAQANEVAQEMRRVGKDKF